MHMCLDQIYPLPSPCKLLPVHLHVLSLFSSYLLSSLSSCRLLRVGPSAGTRATSQGSSDESGTSWTPSPIHTEIVTSLVVCTQSQLRWGHVCDGCVPPLTSCYSHLLLLSYHLSHSTSTMTSEFWLKECDIDIPFRAECSTVSKSLNVALLWISVLSSTVKISFSDESWDILIYGYKEKN